MLEGQSHKSSEELIDYILERYHADLRIRLPQLIALAQEVEDLHSEHPFCPKGLSNFLQQMHEELSMHMLKEENILFPLLRSGRGAVALMPIKVMIKEHDQHSEHLTALGQLSHDFSPPSNACRKWKTLYRDLEELRRELQEHIQLENQILFPRAFA